MTIEKKNAKAPLIPWEEVAAPAQAKRGVKARPVQAVQAMLRVPGANCQFDPNSAFCPAEQRNKGDMGQEQ